MSFTTRCPSCGTVFRVVADQLKISDGWVRCGHCSEVFDATIELDAWLPAASGAQAAPPLAGSLSPGGWQPPPPSPLPTPAPAAPRAAPVVPLPAPREELPSDDDLRAWFGDGPLDPADPRSAEAPAAPTQPLRPSVVGDPEAGAARADTTGEAPEPAQDDESEGFEPLEPGEPGEASAASADAEADSPVDRGSAADEAEPPMVLPDPEAPQPSSDPLDVPSVSSMLSVASHDDEDDGLEPLSGGESDFHAELQRFASSSRAPLAPAVPVDDGSPAEDEAPQDLRDSGAAAVGSAPAVAESETESEREASTAAVPSFVRQAQRQAFWSTPGVRAALALGALLLGLLLLGQWAYHDRHRLVAAQPALKPWVERACGWLDCDLAPVRRLEAIEIESADLVRRLGNFYSFDIVLRNQSALELAPPALELTLTDEGGAVVSRRVFLPQDWPEPVRALPPKDRVSLSFRLSITMGEDEPTAGYRALVFYP